MGASDTIDSRMDAGEAMHALGWWLDSGVDIAISEQPRDWRRAAPPAGKTAAAPGAPPPIEAPADLAAFRSWLEREPGLPLDRPGARRVLPHGTVGAPLMLMADFPSPQECAEGRPFAGDSWVLAQRMLAAIGIAPDAAYLASLACFHAPARGSTTATSIAAGRSRATMCAMPVPTACCCSAMRPRARSPVTRLPRPAARSTASKGCAPSPPSTRAGCSSAPRTRRSHGKICCC